MALVPHVGNRGIALLLASAAAGAVANLGFVLGEPLRVGLPALAASGWALSRASRRTALGEPGRRHAALR
ncbi:MAG: hypothetical protein M0Z33_10050 [Actinomycetota bacterium]|nr:hypothetical protein [Actinomycetota bacterium]